MSEKGCERLDQIIKLFTQHTAPHLQPHTTYAAYAISTCPSKEYRDTEDPNTVYRVRKTPVYRVPESPRCYDAKQFIDELGGEMEIGGFTLCIQVVGTVLVLQYI